MKIKLVLASLFCATLCSCNRGGKPSAIEKIMQNQSCFDTIIGGKQNSLYTLRNAEMAVQITNYGGRIVSLIVPDRNGTPTDVVWGFESIRDYLKAEDVYAGPLVGRYGNRIAQGRFSLNNHSYQLSINNGPNHLHGGTDGFWNKMWDAQYSPENNSLTLSYFSPDGEEGYPGSVMTHVTYTLKKTMHFRLTIQLQQTNRPLTIPQFTLTSISMEQPLKASTPTICKSMHLTSLQPTAYSSLPVK